VVNAILWLLSRPARWLLLLQLHLLLRETQRAEYLADALAARVAGTTATVALQEKLLLEPTFAMVVQRQTRLPKGERARLFEELRAQFRIVPERELERRR